MSNARDLLVLRIPQQMEGERLDKALSHHPLIGSRSKASLLLEQNRVKGPKAKLKASYAVKTGEMYEIELPPPAPIELQPLELALDIVYEDEDLLVVNKPAGLVVHPAAGHAQDTLVNALIHRVKNFSMGFGEARPGIVHRLDKDTSGLLVVAKNDFTQEGLVKQFKARSVSRRYLCIVLSQPRQHQGVIESHLLRHPTQRKKFASEKLHPGQSPKGKKAITHYKLLKTHQGEISLLECRLQTGRTHQIRVHMSEQGTPIVGDKIYGSPSREKKLNKSLRQKIETLQRIGLHASELGFLHPRTGQELFFKASWPEDLRSLITEVGWENVG